MSRLRALRAKTRREFFAHSKVVSPCAALALVSAAQAQLDLGIPAAAIKAIRDNSLLGGPVRNPFQPTGGAGLPNPVPNLSDREGNTQDFELINADEESQLGDRVVLKGNCEFKVRGYWITCDEAIGNTRTRVFALRGHVRIDGQQFQVVQGRQVVIDFLNETYEALDARAILDPSLLQGQLANKLYVKGHESFGSARETTTIEGSVTSCNYPMPHYEIEGDSIVVRPGRRVIFRGTRIKVLGYTVFKLPFLSIPLNNRTYKNTPYVGQSRDEGYFAKFNVGVPLKNPNYNLDNRYDLMSKLGFGLGSNYEYVGHRVVGTASFYHIFGHSDDLIFTNSHHQAFPWGTLSIDTDYEKDNYLVAPNSSIFNSKVALTLPQGPSGSDRISFNDSQSSSFGYSTSSQSIGAVDQRNIGKHAQTEVDVNYFTTSSHFAGGSSSSSGTDTQRMDVHFNAQEDLKTAQASIDYQRSIPIGHTATFIGSSDETPVLSLSSDARRLFGRNVGQEFPFKTLLSWGDFEDPSGKSHISRSFFDFNFNRFDNHKSRFRSDFTGDFRQGIYSDGTAEYVIALGTNLRYDLGQNTGINVRYNYLRPYGYSPLNIDRTGQTDYLSSDLNIRPVRSLLIGAQSGFDILRQQQHQIGWQPIGVRSEFQPARWFLLRFQSTYETFEHQHDWQTLQFDMTYLPGATRLTVGSTYDSQHHVWSTANVFLDNLKWGRMHLATALSYNGFLKQFESEQFNIIYDLHCAEAVFELQENNSGFRAGRQIFFFIRLKAVPYDVPFGVGTRGQPIGFNSGGGQF